MAQSSSVSNKLPDIPKILSECSALFINAIKYFNVYADRSAIKFVKNALAFDEQYTACQRRMLKNHWNTLKICFFS